MKWIAVQGCTLQITTSPAITEGTTTITTLPSIKCKAANKGIYKGTVNVSLSGYSDGTYSQSGTAIGTFVNGSTKNKAEDEFVLLEGDTASNITITLQNTISPFDSKTSTATVKIQSAGQQKVQGN